MLALAVRLLLSAAAVSPGLEVRWITEALKVQGEHAAATLPDGSCACPGHPTRTFCPLDSTPGQCDRPSHGTCQHGGHCPPGPPAAGSSLPISTMNPSITVDSNGTVVLIFQANWQMYKDQQRPVQELAPALCLLLHASTASILAA